MSFKFFPPLGLWSGNFFLTAHFPDHCLLVPFYVRTFRNQHFMVNWFTNLRNLQEGMMFVFSSEKSLYVTNVYDIS